MAAKGFMLKMRPRFAGAKRARARKHVKDDVQRLENLEERLENVTDEINREVEAIEGVKHYVAGKKEFGWIRGELTELALQDFVGAVFGAMFFAFTMEVWNAAAIMSIGNTFLVFLLSFSVGYLLVYLSRRRRFISSRVYRTSFLRAIEIYVMSLFASAMFVFLFSLAPDAGIAFREMVVISLPAVISAATADLLFY